VHAKPAMLWAAPSPPLASRAQRRRWIDGGDHGPVAGLVGVDVVGSMAGSEAVTSAGSSAARRAWLPRQGLRRPGDGLAVRLAAGVTPMATDPVSTAARSCLVVADGSSAPPPPPPPPRLRVVAYFDVGGGGRQLVGGSTVGGSLIFADEVDQRAAAAWGMPICLIKVGDLWFLLSEDRGLPEDGPS
jgi:hypothetical protein